MPGILKSHQTVNSAAGVLIVMAMVLISPAYGRTDRPEISFNVTREGEFIRTEAHVDLQVSPALVWAVLTDYEHYPRFISTMRESKIVSRSPESLVVEQKGQFDFLFFSQAIEAKLQVSEIPPNLILARAIEGSFRVMDGRYELLSTGNGTRLNYSGRLVPEFSLPPIVGMHIVRYILLGNFSEMIDEMLRRDAVARRESAING